MLLFSLFSFFLGLLCVEGGPGDTFLLAGSSAPMLFSFPALQMVGLQIHTSAMQQNHDNYGLWNLEHWRGKTEFEVTLLAPGKTEQVTTYNTIINIINEHKEENPHMARAQPCTLNLTFY